MNVTTNELLKKVDSIYTLCNLVGKRARQLIDGADQLTGCSSKKPVSIAAKEITEGKITYTKNDIAYSQRSVKDMNMQHFI
ncbi:MAG TPA: DNA-directed RNA polymerase subunit omega [Clostridia bacterium]|nr:DNA-directed RNA polymerase subunit omega [Clostridia bacterium]